MTTDDSVALASPRLDFELTESLDQLLERAARASSSTLDFGATAVGECVDTHNPHLPGRVLVQARDRKGTPQTAWLPALVGLELRIGARVLVTKPDNWPEPIVTGAVGGLESSRSRPSEGPQAPRPSSDERAPRVQLDAGEQLEICGPTGAPIARVRSTPGGPELSLLTPDLELRVPGKLRLSAERIELRAQQGGVDVRSPGDTIVRSRTIQLN